MPKVASTRRPQSKPKMGQHFLVGEEHALRIVDALGDVSQSTVLEIGPGRGILTSLIAKRARRLIAAGEIAMRFQHSLNNPLAGILAEAQLLQLESLLPDQHAALERIVGLCRRIIELGRSLDGMGERK